MPITNIGRHSRPLPVEFPDLGRCPSCNKELRALSDVKGFFPAHSASYLHDPPHDVYTPATSITQRGPKAHITIDPSCTYVGDAPAHLACAHCKTTLLPEMQARFTIDFN